MQGVSGASNLELRIAGFGACMISGYPHDAGGMLEVACASVEKQLSRPVRSIVLSLGGFPAPRAAKYLKRKVLGFNPHFVVIQFASTDAPIPALLSAANAAASAWTCVELVGPRNAL
jgi:hypothetical protein